MFASYRPMMDRSANNRIICTLLLFNLLTVVTVPSHGQITLDVNVGIKRITNGVRNYVLRGSKQRNNPEVRITCVSLLPFPSNLTLFRNHSDEIEAEEILENRISKTATKIDPLGMFTCRQRFESRKTSSSTGVVMILFESETTVNITKIDTRYDPVMSSVGELGYYGENVLITCVRNVQNKKGIFFSFHEVTLPYNFSQLGCSNEHTSPMKILRELEVAISPDNFTDEDLEDLTFVCKTMPPRLTYWTIIGANGNIMNFNELTHTMKASLNVTIKQTAGESSLRLAEAVIGGNGIHTVKCSSYDTRAHVVAVARRDVGQQETVPSPSDFKSVSVVLITCTTVLGVITFVLVVIIVKLRLYQNVQDIPISNQDDVKTEVISKDTEMQDNPLYLAFSETSNQNKSVEKQDDLEDDEITVL